MSATEILFNSPALHSLKRTQLVQLCKRHNIKASGKNIDLIARLKQHALTLPTDSLLDVAMQDEQTSEAESYAGEDDAHDENKRPQRPSEMWEIVMDDIPEEDTSGSQQNSVSSKNTLVASMIGEFGAGESSKSTVSSSIKALATSLGLKRSQTSNTMSETTSHDTIASLKSVGRNKMEPRAFFGNSANTRDSLTAHAVPYSSIPHARPSQLPHIEPFAFSYDNHADTSLASVSSLDRPVPGIGGRDGVEVNKGSRTEGTIRLITTPFLPQQPSPPKLAPFRPIFDLVPPTPGKRTVRRWPVSPGVKYEAERQILHPNSSLDQAYSGDTEGIDVSMPGGLHPQRLQTSLQSPREPFIFGSPNPRHSTTKDDFTNAASNVLAEMNARLGLTGDKAVGINLLAGREKLPKLSEEELLNYQFGRNKGSYDKARGDGQSASSRFDRAHEKEFSKMEGIDTHTARRAQSRLNLAEMNEKTESLAPLPVNRKRRSSVLESNEGIGIGRPSNLAAKKRRSSATRVISAASRRKMGMGIPGAFGCSDDEEEEVEEERETKRICVEHTSGERVKRVSIAPPAIKSDYNNADVDGEKQRKQNEAIKRKLEYQKARRRSSKGRPSIAPRASLTAQKRGATSRFGFLASARTLVKSVWNRGAGNPSTSSAIPVSKPAPKANTESVAKGGPTKTGTTTVMQKPPLANAKKSDISARPSSIRPPTSRNVSNSSNGFLKPGNAALRMTGTISSINSTNSALSCTSTNTNASRPRSRSPIPSFNPPSDSIKSARSESSGPRGSVLSSVRTRTANIRSSGDSRGLSGVSSIGTRTSMMSVPASGSVSSMGAHARARPSSTLYAPTVSSLAKTNTNTRRPSTTVNKIQEKSNERRVPSGTASPSKIPVVLPLSPRKRNLAGEAPGIFSSPLAFHANPASKGIAGEDKSINPITGILSTTQGQHGTDENNALDHVAPRDVSSVKRMQSVQRKPRISRSKVIAKLGAQRAASGSSGSNVGRGRTRSSIGTAGTQARRSVGGVKAANGLANVRRSGIGSSDVLMSAKKRARMSEYARRRSSKASTPLKLGNSEDMDIDD